MKLLADSPYRHPLNTAVLKLQQSGLITELKKKWWTQKRGGGTCRVRTETNTLVSNETIPIQWNNLHALMYGFYTIRVGRRWSEPGRGTGSRQCGWRVPSIIRRRCRLFLLHRVRVTLGSWLHVVARKRKSINVLQFEFRTIFVDFAKRKNYSPGLL